MLGLARLNCSRTFLALEQRMGVDTFSNHRLSGKCLGL